MMNLRKSDFDVLISTIIGIVILIIALTILITSCNANTSNNTQAENNISNSNSESNSDLNANSPANSNSSNSPTGSNDMTTSSAPSNDLPQEPETTINPEDLIDFDVEHPYLIRVNRAENFATVYGMDVDGVYSIVYKTFICSTGLIPENTPLGVYKTSDMYRWRLMVDGTYAQYAIRINGQIMLHSVPYTAPSNDTLEYWEYNKLGQPASLGCVRFRVSAIKWIYDNCNVGTTVIIYDEPGESPTIPLKRIKKIKESNPNSNWDPTDPDDRNPWND